MITIPEAMPFLSGNHRISVATGGLSVGERRQYRELNPNGQRRTRETNAHTAEDPIARVEQRETMHLDACARKHESASPERAGSEYALAGAVAISHLPSESAGRSRRANCGTEDWYNACQGPIRGGRREDADGPAQRFVQDRPGVEAPNAEVRQDRWRHDEPPVVVVVGLVRLPGQNAHVST
jgi:hypothetical protein